MHILQLSGVSRRRRRLLLASSLAQNNLTLGALASQQITARARWIYATGFIITTAARGLFHALAHHSLSVRLLGLLFVLFGSVNEDRDCAQQPPAMHISVTPLNLL